MSLREEYEALCKRMKLSDNRFLYEKLYGVERTDDKESHEIRRKVDRVIPNLLSDIDTEMDSIMKIARIRECETALNKAKNYLDTNGWK